MMKENYGYGCVQLLNDSTINLKKTFSSIGVPVKKIIIDKIVGENPKHPGLDNLMETIHKGDCLYVSSLYNLGNSIEEIIQRWDKIFNKIHCDIVVLDMPFFDTRKGNTKHCDKTIRDISIETFDYLNRTRIEEAVIRLRAGCEDARIVEIHGGRKRIEIPDNFKEICKKYWDGQIGAREAGRLLDVSHVTFMRWYKAYYSDQVNPCINPNGARGKHNRKCKSNVNAKVHSKVNAQVNSNVNSKVRKVNAQVNSKANSKASKVNAKVM